MSDYASQAIHSLDKSGAAITAAQARQLATSNTKTNTLNYSLMIRLVFERIRAAATKGDTRLEIHIPSYVPGGTVCDPILIARQIKKKLTTQDVGFSVERSDDLLTIAWESD